MVYYVLAAGCALLLRWSIKEDQVAVELALANVTMVVVTLLISVEITIVLQLGSVDFLCGKPLKNSMGSSTTSKLFRRDSHQDLIMEDKTTVNLWAMEHFDTLSSICQKYFWILNFLLISCFNVPLDSFPYFLMLYELKTIFD